MRLNLLPKPPPRMLRALVAVGILASAFTVFYVNSKDPRDLGAFDRLVLRVSAPAQAVAAGAWRWADGQWDEYVALVGLGRENVRLEQEVRVLRERLHQAREAELENRRLRRLLQLGERVRLSYRPARVVAYDPSSPYRTLRIDRGSSGGIARGQAVITDEGVVGKVLRVWSAHSDVLLMTDPRSAVDGFVQRNRVQGTVEGLGAGTCRMKYLLRGADVRDGDVIITSGYDGVFPRGLPVGVVRGDRRHSYGVAQDAEVIPYVDLTRVEEVLVLDSGPGIVPDESWPGGEMR